jgi:hypothetical protein
VAGRKPTGEEHESGPEAPAARRKYRRGASGAGGCCTCGVRPKAEYDNAEQLPRRSSSAIAAVSQQRRQQLQRLHEELRPLSAAELEVYCAEVGVDSTRLAKARETEDPAGALITLAIAAEPLFLACGPSPTGPPPRLHLSPARARTMSNGIGLELELPVDETEKVRTGSKGTGLELELELRLDNTEKVRTDSPSGLWQPEDDAVSPETGREKDWVRGTDSDDGSSTASSETVEARRLRAESQRLGQTIVLQDIARAKAAGETFDEFKARYRPVGVDGVLLFLWGSDSLQQSR